MLRRALFLTLVLAASAAIAQPASKTAPAQPAPGARDDLVRTEREQQLREEQRDQWREDAARTRQEIDELNAQLAELAHAQANGEKTVSDDRLRLAALNVRETELSTRAGHNQNQLAHLLGALEMFSKSPPPALFVHPRDAQDAVRAAILIKAVTPELERRAKVFAGEAQQARLVRRRAAAQSSALFTAESDVADRAGRMEVLVAQKTAMERGLTAEAMIADRDIAALAARAQALRAVVGRLPPAPAGPPRKAFTALTTPVPGKPYRLFGQVERSGARSEGWTWRTEGAAAVSAPAGGIVEYAGPVAGWSNVVILSAGDDYHLVLAGLDLLGVRAGQSVAQGQLLGRMAKGSTLSLGSDSPELRLEVRKNGTPVDPARFVRAGTGG